MPSRARLIWVYTVALLVGLPVVMLLFATLRFASKTQDARSLENGFFGAVLIAALAAPVVLSITWFCLRRYSPDARLLAWRKNRLVQSVSATLFFGAAAIGLAYMIVADVVEGGPWYDCVFIAYFALWIYWCLMLRAAVVDQQSAAALKSADATVTPYRNVEIEVKAIHHADTYKQFDLKTYAPPDENFFLPLIASIGPVGERGADDFEFAICSLKWLEAEVERETIVSGHQTLFMRRYSYEAVEAFLKDRLIEAGSANFVTPAPDWEKIATRLATWSHWEFHDDV